MNPSPSLQGALWSGNQQLATKKQLISSITGVYNDLKDLSGFDFTNINASTIHVSTLYAGNIDLSGITLDPSGVFIVTDVSGNYSQFNFQLMSSMSFKFDPTIQVQINVGDATFGFLTGLGALLFQTLLGVGAGAGAAFQGIGNGIAAMIMANGSQNTYINQNNFELIGGSTQLQISTIGNAYPAYSSIMRYVSSISPNQVPGAPEYISTIFYPGQICIRSISDPFPIMSQDPNIRTSTIQQFGEWVPLEGLEPENIVANSISTNSISSGQITADLALLQDVIGYSAQFSNAGFATSASLNYQAPLQFQTGATNYASFVGDLNRLYCYNNTGYIFSGAGGTQESASLYLGQNTNESLLNISTINSVGGIKTQSLFASTITAENLNVISTFFLTSTSFENITSTNILNVDTLLAQEASIASFVSSFSFTTPVGNPYGAFDINRVNNYTSTTYNAVSSLTQNILNYSLNIGVQDEASFNIYNGQSQLALYSITPNNVSAWASTNLIFNTYEVPGQIDLGWVGLWGVSPGASTACPGGATFDVTYTYSNGYANSFLITEQSNATAPYGVSTFFNYGAPNPGFTGLSTFRFTLPPVVGGSRSGWWNFVTPAPPPYESQNNNTFQIYQDINDTYITATDRLHLKAGDIVFDGNTTLSNVDIANFNASNINTTFLSTLSTSAFGDDAYFNTNIWVDNAVVGWSGNFSSITTTIGEVNFPNWQSYWSSNISPPSMLSSFQYSLSTTLIQSIFQPFYNRPVLSLNPGINNDMTLSKLGTWLYNGVPNTSNYALGTFVITPPDNSFKIYTDNNGFGLNSNLQVVNLSNASATQFMSLYIGFPSPAINIPANSGLSVYWNNTTGLWTSGTYTDWGAIGATSEVDMLQGYNYLSIVSPSTIMTSNVTIGGTLSLTGKTITTFQMTWNHPITFGSQHGYGAVSVQDGNGNSYSASAWRMVFSPHLVELNNNAYAMNSWEVSPAIDGNGNWIINFSVYYTTTMANDFDIYFWASVVMYPLEMIDVMPAKNWGSV